MAQSLPKALLRLEISTRSFVTEIRKTIKPPEVSRQTESLPGDEKFLKKKKNDEERRKGKRVEQEGGKLSEMDGSKADKKLFTQRRLGSNRFLGSAQKPAQNVG